MNDLIIGKVSTALKGHWANPDLVSRPAPHSPSESGLLAEFMSQLKLVVQGLPCLLVLVVHHGF